MSEQKTGRLHFVRPAQTDRALAEGRGQRVFALRIPDNLTAQMLREDIQNGAEQFAEIPRAFQEYKDLHVTVLLSSSREDARKAVSYIQAVNNQQENNFFSNNDFDEWWDEVERTIGDVKLPGFDDEEDDEVPDPDEAAAQAERVRTLLALQEKNPAGQELVPDSWGKPCYGDVSFAGGELDYAEDGPSYSETSGIVPIIDMENLHSFNENTAVSTFVSGQVEISGQAQARKQRPYWADLSEEAVLLEWDITKTMVPLGDADYAKDIERFLSCRHIYLAIINRNRDGFEGLPDNMAQYLTRQIAFFRFRYDAAVIPLKRTSDGMRRYADALLATCLEQRDLTLSGDFHREPVLDLVLDTAQGGDVAERMDQVVMYALLQKKTQEALTDADFAKVTAMYRHAANLNNAAQKRFNEQMLHLDGVKEKLHTLINTLEVGRLRQLRKLSNDSFHCVLMFAGNPGTGKTETAKALGRILCEKGLLQGSRFYSCSAAQLKASYVGQTAPAIRRIFEENDVIFIDEFYSLVETNEAGQIDQFAQEALGMLAVCLESYQRCVIFSTYGGTDKTGRDARLQKVLAMNPGIASRINMTIDFPDYAPSDLADITMHMLEEENFAPARGSRNTHRLLESYFHRIHCSGNAREARNVADAVRAACIDRLAAGKENPENYYERTPYTMADVRKALEARLVQNRLQDGERTGQIGLAAGA